MYTLQSFLSNHPPSTDSLVDSIAFLIELHITQAGSTSLISEFTSFLVQENDISVYILSSFVESQLVIYIYVYLCTWISFQIFHFDSLVYMSVSMPEACGLHCYSPVVCL